MVSKWWCTRTHNVAFDPSMSALPSFSLAAQEDASLCCIMNTPPPCISYANVQNYYGAYAYCSLDNGVACAQHIQLPTQMRRPHVLKLAIQDLWGASD